MVHFNIPPVELLLLTLAEQTIWDQALTSKQEDTKSCKWEVRKIETEAVKMIKAENGRRSKVEGNGTKPSGDSMRISLANIEQRVAIMSGPHTSSS